MPERARAQFQAPKTVEELENEPAPKRDRHGKKKADVEDENEGLPTDTGPDPDDEDQKQAPAALPELEGQAPRPAAFDAGSPAALAKGGRSGRGRDAGIDGEPAPDAGAAAAVLVPPIELPKSSWGQLLESWDKRRRAVQSHNPKAQADAEQELQAQREELGIHDLTAMAAALDHEALRRLEAKDPAEASRLAGLAVTLAPDSAAPRFALARVQLSSDAGSLGDAFSAAKEGLLRALGSPGPRLAFLGNLGAAALFGFGLAALLALLALALRPLRYALHDFHHLFPRGALPAQTAVLFALVLALPWAFRLGPMAELAALVAASLLYMRPAERGVSTALLAFLAAIPLLAGLGGRQLLYAGTVASDVERVQLGGPDAADAVAHLEEQEQSGKADFPGLFVLGLDAKRAGHLDRAAERFRHALALNPRSAEATNNLANVLLLQGDLDGARDAYLHASELAPDSASIHYNLAKLSTRRAQLLGGPNKDVSDDIERGKAATAAVYRLDRTLMDRPNDSRANLYVLDLELASAALSSSDARSTEGALAEQLKARLWGSFAPSVSMGMAALMLLVFWGLALSASRLKPCSECTRCGRAVCGRCDREVAGGALCGQCHNAFVKKGAVDPSTRLAKEKSARRYQERWLRVRRWASYLLAGMGHLLSGRPLAGVAFLLAALGAAAAVLLGDGVFRIAFGTALAPARQILGGLVLIGVWALSIRSYRTSEERRV